MTSTAGNRLRNSASAYLRSAEHQPVDWHEWGEEAFARARAEDKPILLDIGAVWCHWCHVIDRESYENPEIAALINQLYIPVKVDRDERPDVDARYQSAISAISGQGGWPLTGFLTPDGRPFFGGTYFPPDDAMGRPGFRRILPAVAEAYRSRRAEVDKSAQTLADSVAQAEALREGRGPLSPRLLDEMEDATVRQFDIRNGGFGRAPKFPHPAAVDFLAERYQSSGARHLLSVLETTLTKMARGGVYDQIGGGFHRYSVDERWCVPHFEKMSYDNAPLLLNYLHAWQITGDPLFRRTAEGIIRWTDAVLSDPPECGGFYASQDADISLDDDGDYFTWTQDEVRAVLPADEALAIELYYDVEPVGEMHHNQAKNVLWIARELPEIVTRMGKSESEVEALLASGRKKLLEARGNRPTPAVDRALYTGWNAMYVSAYLEAGRLFGREDCRSFALHTLDRLLAEAWDPARGFAHRLGGPRLDGSLDDQVFTAAALLDGFEATLDRRYFDAAARAIDLTLDLYGDAEGGAFYDRSRLAAPMGGLEVRRKPFQDSPTPSGNSCAAMVLARIHAYTGEKRYLDAARATLESFAGLAPQYGLFATSYALALALHLNPPIHVVVLGRAGDPLAERLEQAALAIHRFGRAVLRVTPEQLSGDVLPAALAATLPHLTVKTAHALICAGGVCHPPTANPDELRKYLAPAAALAAP
ncbi:MAG TPA: thioredoxin domain-containing protein [Candidatus Acidoferrales bacterium]|nr:thioredoxin domain-containing protein [Candidatus Acidoferrales bacterium]